MDIQPGYVDYETKRVAITVADYANSEMNGDEYAYLYRKTDAEFGLDPWTLVDSVDKFLNEEDKYEMWRPSYCTPIITKGDRILFVSAKHYQKYFAKT